MFSIKNCRKILLSKYFYNFTFNKISLVLLFLISTCAMYSILFYNNFAAGFDGYYYVLQVSSFRQTGKLLISDNSIILYFLGAINIFLKNPVTAVKTGALIISSASVIPFFLILCELKISRVVSVFVSILFIFSFSHNYISTEYIKNSGGILFFLFFIYFFLRSKYNKKYIACVIVFVFLTIFSHKLMGGLCIVFICTYFLANLIFYDKIQIFIKAGLVFIFFLIFFLFFLYLRHFPIALLKSADLTYLIESLTLNNIPGKFNMIKNLGVSNAEKIEYLFFHLIPFAFTFFLFKKDFRNNKSILCIYFLSLFTIIPFINFNFTSISFRLMLISFVPCLILCAIMIDSIKYPAFLHPFENQILFHQKNIRTTVIKYSLMTLILASVFVYANPFEQAKLFHNGRYPDYSKYNESFSTIKYLVPAGSKIIAHKGISSFIWYVTGLEATHFQPLGENGNYYRITYGLCPLHFEDLISDVKFQKPVELQWPYMLVQEKLWQNYIKANHSFLTESVYNPSEIRPPYVYSK